MRALVVATLVAWSCGATADIPKGIAQRVARFVFDGCDYLTANSPEPHKPEPPDKKLAAHFGRIVSTRPEGRVTRYILKTTAFDGWNISYLERGVDIKFPATTAITIGDLQRFFGPDDAPDVDYALSTTSSDTRIEIEDREFNLKREDYCHVTVEAEADKKKGAARRVFSLRFID